MSDGIPDGERREITIEVDRLDRMVQAILDYSALEAGRSLAPATNTADDLISAAIRQVVPLVRNRPVRATTAGGVLIGRFDLEQTLRCLVNLLENAARYSPDGTPIDIRASPSEGALRLEVGDRGAGVPAGEEERIFLPFYRPSGSPPDGGRMGLGLAIARRIAEAQNGSLAYSRREGGGSLFVLRLPLAD